MAESAIVVEVRIDGQYVDRACKIYDREGVLSRPVPANSPVVKRVPVVEES